MLSQYLYDKEIKVTLIKDSKIETIPMRTFTSLGYEESSINKKKVLYSRKSIDTINSTSDTRAAMAFYQGYYRRSVTTLENGKTRIARQLATGPLYKYNTLDDMKKGVHPDGSLMKTGDRLYVIEDKSSWNVVVSGDKNQTTEVESVEREVKAERLVISSDTLGMKPDITFSVNLLPGQNCYKAVLRIKNLNIDALDIRFWDRMVIEAGYRIGETALFNCPIYSSYVESPNPDGVIVFEGITVGQTEAQWRNNPVEIHFNTESVTLHDLIESCSDGIMEGIKVKDVMGKELQGLTLSVSKQVVYAENGLAVLNWLQNTVAKVVMEQSCGESSVLIQVMNTTLSVIAINGPNATSTVEESAIDLSMVSSATFNGTALTVEAPWNPGMRPGGLFYLPPNFINGSKLPNVMSSVNYRNVDNLYRALTMSIVFATVENTNRMSILAVPAQFAGAYDLNMATDMTPEDYAALKNVVFKEDESHSFKVDVGSLSKEEKAGLAVEQQSAGVETFDSIKNITKSWGSFVSLRIDAPLTGNCLSQIAQYYCVVWGNGAKLTKGKLGENKEATYYKPIDDLPQKAQEHYQKGGIPCWALWWPLIAVSTYWIKKEDIAAGVNNNWTDIDLNNPDKIWDGKHVYIPVFSSYSQISRFKDVYKYVYQEYGQKYVGWAPWWRAAYYYFGGTDEID